MIGINISINIDLASIINFVMILHIYYYGF
jgi:hypothetical protein